MFRSSHAGGHRALLPFFLLLVLFTPCICYANAGFVVVEFDAILMIVALIPVIFLEALVGFRSLALSYLRTLAAFAKANLLSLVVGFPIVGAFQFLVALVANVAGYSIVPVPHESAPAAGTTMLKAIVSGFYYEPVWRPAAWKSDSAGFHSFREEVWEPSWYGPVTFAFCFFLCFLVSCAIESWLVKKYSTASEATIRRTVLVANAVSYLLLVSYVFLPLVRGHFSVYLAS